MPTFNRDIFSLTGQNQFFRREVLTNEHSQLVLMSLKPGENIGEEVHGWTVAAARPLASA